MKNLTNEQILRNVTLDGMMSFSQFENGTIAAQFECCEEVNMEPQIKRCKVQTMCDGNVYITVTQRETTPLRQPLCVIAKFISVISTQRLL